MRSPLSLHTPGLPPKSAFFLMDSFLTYTLFWRVVRISLYVVPEWKKRSRATATNEFLDTDKFKRCTINRWQWVNRRFLEVKMKQNAEKNVKSASALSYVHRCTMCSVFHAFLHHFWSQKTYGEENWTFLGVILDRPDDILSMRTVHSFFPMQTTPWPCALHDTSWKSPPQTLWHQQRVHMNKYLWEKRPSRQWKPGNRWGCSAKEKTEWGEI